MSVHFTGSVGGEHKAPQGESVGVERNSCQTVTLTRSRFARANVANNGSKASRGLENDVAPHAHLAQSCQGTSTPFYDFSFEAKGLRLRKLASVCVRNRSHARVYLSLLRNFHQLSSRSCLSLSVYCATTPSRVNEMKFDEFSDELDLVVAGAD